jgi:hypothetical protein
MVTYPPSQPAKHCWPMHVIGSVIGGIWTASVRLLRRSFCGTAEYGGHVEGKADFDVVLA